MMASMRLAVFLLVLANLLFLVWTRGYLGAPANPDARRIEQQLLADQITVVARGDPPRATSRDGDKALDKKAAASCQLWSDLTSAEADQLERLFTDQFATFKATRLAEAEFPALEVHGPEAQADALQKAIAALLPKATATDCKRRSAP